MTYETGGRESGVVAFKENDEVRVNDDAVLAPEAIRGEVGTIVKINRFLSEPTQLSESIIAVDRYQQLVKQPRETEILGFALQVFFPKIGDSLLVASNEVTLLSKFQRKDRQTRRQAHRSPNRPTTIHCARRRRAGCSIHQSEL